MAKKHNVIYELLNLGNSIFDSIVKDRKKFLVISLLGLLGLFVITRFERIFFTVLMIFLASVSLIYIRFFKYAHYIGFELCMMATVLASLVYGPGVGAFTGLVTITSALILSGYFKPSYFISVLALPLIGLIVPFFSGLELWQLGILMTVIYDIIVLPLYVMMGSRIVSSAVFFITHVLFNYWVFTTLAPFFYRLIS